MITTTTNQFPPTEVQKSLVGLVGLESFDEDFSVSIISGFPSSTKSCSLSAARSWSLQSALQRRLARLRDFLADQQQLDRFDAAQQLPQQPQQQEKHLLEQQQQQKSLENQQRSQQHRHLELASQQERPSQQGERNHSEKSNDNSGHESPRISKLPLLSVTLQQQQQQGAQEQQERLPAMVGVPDEFYEIFKRHQSELC